MNRKQNETAHEYKTEKLNQRMEGANVQYNGIQFTVESDDIVVVAFFGMSRKDEFIGFSKA